MERQNRKLTAEQAMQEIYDLLFLDTDEKGDFYSPDKEQSGADFIEAVGGIVERWKPAPKRPADRPVED